MKKTSSLIFVLAFALSSFTAGAENVRGDVDLDGRVNIADVTSLIDYLLTNDATGISLANADSDLDGRVNIADVTKSIDYLLTGSWGDEPVTPPDDHEWVDLGLPSGTLWATCNVGASSPEDYGDYFAWGETEPKPKEIYFWTTYKWCNGSVYTMTKYCTSSSYGYNGFVDNKTELDFGDDAAYVNWGVTWRMPSQVQIKELVEQCTWAWETRNGVNGRLVIGPNGNTIFLPAAGYRLTVLLDVGNWGGYWSRTLCSDDETLNSTSAYFLYFASDDVRWFSPIIRCGGQSVRAVRVP